MADLRVHLAGLTFTTPLVLASGPAGFGLELAEGTDLGAVGALTTKTITPQPQAGNPPPRLADAPCGALNSIGLANPGLDAFLEQVLPAIRGLAPLRIVSIAAARPDEVGRMAERLDEAAGVDLVELNLSCPNVEGEMPGRDPDATAAFVRAAARRLHRPLLAKVSPEAPDLVRVAGAALTAGAAGLTLINAIQGMRIDRQRGVPVFHRSFAGLSGPAIFPIALAKVFTVRRAFPTAFIVGTGGVADLGAVVEMAMAGADLVGIGAGIMATPALPVQLSAGLSTWLAEHKLASFREICSCAHRGGF
ncbi:MAG: dihydroorotate dehydrogenase [Candidatus Bipolaricaulaceae bacterium]